MKAGEETAQEPRSKPPCILPAPPKALCVEILPTLLCQLVDGEENKVRIGGMSIGEILKDGYFSVSRKRIANTDQWEMDGIGLSKFRRFTFTSYLHLAL